MDTRMYAFTLSMFIALSPPGPGAAQGIAQTGTGSVS